MKDRQKPTEIGTHAARPAPPDVDPAPDGDPAEAARESVAGGRLTEAERLFEKALSAAEVAGDEMRIASLQLEIGELRFRRGDHGAARASAVAALEIFGRLGQTLRRAEGTLLLGQVLAESTAVELAEKRLSEAARIGRQAGAVGVEMDALIALAQLHRREGRLPDAFRNLQEASTVLLSDPPTLATEDEVRRAEALEARYFELARDAFVLGPHGHSEGILRAEGALRIARALLERIEMRPAEQIPIILASFFQQLLEEKDAPPKEILLPSAAAELLGQNGEGDSFRRGIVYLVQRLEKVLREGGNTRSMLASLRNTDWPGDDGLLSLAEDIDWDALIAPGAPQEFHNPAVQALPPAQTSPGRDGDRRRLLVVDDDPEVRTILSDYFGAKGYSVATASTGDGLFTTLSRVQPDLVLLDIMLPGRDGRTLLERIRGSLSWGHIPVIMITGIRDPQETARALQRGADDYVEKPINPPALQARIERLLALRQALKEAEHHRDRQGLLLDIIRDLTGSLDTQNLLDRLVRRVAEATGVAKCSLVLAEPEPGKARLALAYDNPTLHDLPLDLDRYPEIRTALETGEVVFIPDVYTEPLLNAVRREWATAVNVRSSAVIPLITEGSPVGAFFIRTTWDEPAIEPSTIDFAREVAQAAGTALEYARLFERIAADLRQAEEKVDTYRALSMTDPLTGLANRAGLEASGNSLFASAASLDHPLSVLMLDLDKFKELNDLHGHSAGDEVLKAVAEALLDGTLDHSVVARYGGDEFCMVLPYWQIDEASRYGKVLCERIREIRIPELDGSAISASIGVASYPLIPAASLEQLIVRADQALYRAKRGGGGHLQVTFAT